MRKKYTKLDLPLEQIFNFLFNDLKKIGKMCSGVMTAIRERAGSEKIPKKTILLKKGQVCDSCYFVVSGLLRAYSLKGNKEVTLWVMTTGDVAIGVTSFYDQAPSEEYIEALEDTVVVSLSYDHLQWIYENYVEFNVIGRKLTEKYHKLFNMRLCTMVDSREERYNKFVKDYPGLVDRIHGKYLASLLGMSPSYLSTIKTALKLL
ncbi:cyclic nucleotide-binding domain-containing protein [Chitinophaga sp. SYP-B3965]|uniref:Crp/Fnr family transcriptional regulator n=1 Tax=Chitinophaga sp. SYP-B3965 TaxID=2663120 RepID=UPI001299DCD2|nr:cyclic nucleotide-binding domain-containing protein [Chitinophaga sp. SYP-B3965]MRG46958.1 cyclic nucleotide-binding domain-containing protein [Chitinophaga sp. SYP-B3965]